MICLIKNLTQIPVGDKLPVETDTSKGADLSRVKYYRNMLYHSKNETLSDELFQKYWTELSEVFYLKDGVIYTYYGICLFCKQ